MRFFGNVNAFRNGIHYKCFQRSFVLYKKAILMRISKKIRKKKVATLTHHGRNCSFAGRMQKDFNRAIDSRKNMKTCIASKQASEYSWKVERGIICRN